LGGGAAECGHERVQPVRILVGYVGARVAASVGVGEIDGVCFAASTHGDVDPFPVDAAAGDGVDTAGRGSLGFVAGEGVAPVEVVFVEVPTRDGDRVACPVQAHGDVALLDVDGCDTTEVAVEDSDSGSVLETDDSVPPLEGPVGGNHCWAGEPPVPG